jgi:hypothetical protein
MIGGMPIMRNTPAKTNSEVYVSLVAGSVGVEYAPMAMNPN